MSMAWEEHPTDLLPLVAEGVLPAPDVRSHIDRCERCGGALAGLSPLDLDYVWMGVAAELEAPRETALERAFRALGLEASLARFAGATPSLGRVWVLATTLVVAVASALPFFVPVGGGMPVAPLLLLAPLVAAAVVAFASGPVADPAYEAVAATPVSPILALLVRLTAVLALNALLVGAGAMARLAVTGRFTSLTYAWLLPMVAVSLFSAVVGSRTQPLIGAASGMGVWLVLVFEAYSTQLGPHRLLWGSIPQAAFGMASVALLALLVWWTTQGGTRFAAPGHAT
jgi:hypothetical protein